MAVAVIDSLRVESMPAESGPPRSRAPRSLRNFRAKPAAQELHGGGRSTPLAEEHRHPELLAAFRRRLVEPRRAALRRAPAEGISSRGTCRTQQDPDVLASMLIGSVLRTVYRHLRHTR